MRITALVAIAACCVCMPFCMPAARAADVADVIIESITRPCMAGSFVRGGTGLRFQTCKEGASGSLRVSGLAGAELIYIRQERGDLVISVQSQALTLRVPGPVLAEARALTSARLAFAGLNAATQMWGDTNAIAELGRTPEYALLPELSYQLGKLGITGRAYPPSFLLHALALGAAEQLGIEPRQPEIIYHLELPPELAAAGFDLLQALWPDPCAAPEAGPPDVERPPACPEKCTAFPNRDQNCYGMCGPGCEGCWPWVCGDCCYHAFCAVHDELARACEDSANPIVCLSILPWYFILGGCDGPLFERLPR
jgi:hypothetical protein